MKYREIIFFIKLKFIIGCRNMFEHTCHGILFIVMSVFKLKIQNDSKAFLNEFQMAFGKKNKRKGKPPPLHLPGPKAQNPSPRAQPARALPLSLPFLLWRADPTTRVADGLAPLVGAVFYPETARSRTPHRTVSQSLGRVPLLPDPARQHPLLSPPIALTSGTHWQRCGSPLSFFSMESKLATEGKSRFSRDWIVERHRAL